MKDETQSAKVIISEGIFNFVNVIPEQDARDETDEEQENDRGHKPWGRDLFNIQFSPR